MLVERQIMICLEKHEEISHDSLKNSNTTLYKAPDSSGGVDKDVLLS